jgi:hypothetical protein
MDMKKNKEVEKETECNLLCAFCNHKWSWKMMTQLTNTELEWWYYEDIESVEAYTTIKIFCENCGKLLYEKEIINKSNEYKEIMQ